jgi:alcohol dehydrogenase (cytochrome c)
LVSSLALAQAPTFSSGQYEQGRVLYTQQCARCHGADLSDGEFGPALIGSGFNDHWAGHSVADLFNFTRQAMPPNAAGSLSDAAYAQLVAYVLGRNGVSAGSTDLSADAAALTQMRIPGIPPSLPGPSGGLTSGAVLPPWPSAANPLDNYSAVSDEMLSKPAPGDWLSWRRSLDDGGFSPLSQISRQNVKNLQVAWSLALPPGANEATPLVHDGVLFARSPNDSVLALDAASGRLLWRYTRSLPQGTPPSSARNMALSGQRLFYGTSDSHVVALNVTNGKVIWDHPVDDPKIWRISGGPMVAQGRVMQGVTGRAPGGGFIVGLDANTGEETWRFFTIAQPGDPNDKSWNDTPLEKRNGGSVWMPGSYDPDLKLAFFGIAQTYDTAPLLHRVAKRGITNDGLYLDSTVALDPQTGQKKWYFQHLPDDQWDYDFVFERQVLQLPIDGHLTKVVLTAGKPAIYDALRAQDGHYLFSIDLGLQNFVTAIDPKSGAKHIDPARYPDQKQPFMICPHAGGAKSWLPASFNPQSHIVYVPLVESCMDLTPTPPGEHGSLSAGVRWTLRPRPDSDGKYGRVEAINLDTRQVLWTQRQRAPQTSGVLDTGGGIVFAGALDRSFAAYDDQSGEVLWKNVLTDVPSAAPIAYEVGGREYIAMVVGYGGAQAATFPGLVPEIALPAGSSSAIWVFALPPEHY